MELLLSAIGHLGRDCSVKHFEGGNTAITFVVCTNESYVDRSGTKHDQVLWVECTLWRQADKLKIADSLKRGTLVKVSGRPSVRGFKAKQSDEIKASLNLRVDNIRLLAPPKNRPVTQNTETDTSVTSASMPATQEDDLPF